MHIQLAKDFLGQSAGVRFDMPDAEAQSLIDQGVAQMVDDPLGPALTRSLQPALDAAIEKSLGQMLRRRGADKSMPFAAPIDLPSDARSGFKNFGEFALAVRDACQPGKRPDDRLAPMLKAPSGMGESVNADGGFLVPTEFSQKLLERVYANSNLLGMTDQYVVSGNSIAFPRNAETSRANGSRWGGVRAYWRSEGDQAAASRPTFGQLSLTLSKLFVMITASDELLADTQGLALEQYLLRVASEEINFVVGDSILNGSGSGQPLGILGAPCLVTVAKETGQAAATLTANNVAAMWSRLWAPCRQNAVWLINQDVESQLNTMTVGAGSSAMAAYLPPGGLSSKPYATLLGRPVHPVEWCPTLGTVGDVVLADLRHYVTITKGMVESAMSIHLRFDYDESTFRFIFRVDGKPWWNAALTPYKGSNTQSCFVALATRA
ncbi:MAG: phage major capsid protein [Gemmataceae bacterium]|nr:phage major capsid protein [Gemmataceae bacterium]